MALGARRGEMLWMVLRETLLLVAMGVAIGLPASLAATRLLQDYLFELKPTDPATIGAAVLMLGGDRGARGISAGEKSGARGSDDGAEIRIDRAATRDGIFEGIGSAGLPRLRRPAGFSTGKGRSRTGRGRVTVAAVIAVADRAIGDRVSDRVAGIVDRGSWRHRLYVAHSCAPNSPACRRRSRPPRPPRPAPWHGRDRENRRPGEWRRACAGCVSRVYRSTPRRSTACAEASSTMAVSFRRHSRASSAVTAACIPRLTTSWL